jgi:hypothetical protein
MKEIQREILRVGAAVILATMFSLVLVGCDNDDGGNNGNGNSSVFTVSYDVGAGSGIPPNSQTVSSGATIYLPGQGNMSAPSGQNFNGWRTGGQIYSASDSFTVTGNITFIAQWNSTSTGTGSAPNAPSNVTATALSSSSISVSWSSVAGATSYKVYYEIGSSSTKNLAGTATSTSYTHTGLQSGTTYYYYIKAVNSAGESDYSSYDYATTSSGTVAGSSSSNAITIPSGGVSGSFPSGLDAVWYKFTRSGSGMLSASDREYSSTYTSDIVVDVYDSDNYLIEAPIIVNGTNIGRQTLSGIDVGDTRRIYATNWSGTYYVKVRPYGNSSSNKGTFAIFFTGN